MLIPCSVWECSLCWTFSPHWAQARVVRPALTGWLQASAPWFRLWLKPSQMSSTSWWEWRKPTPSWVSSTRPTSVPLPKSWLPWWRGSVRQRWGTTPHSVARTERIRPSPTPLQVSPLQQATKKKQHNLVDVKIFILFLFPPLLLKPLFTFTFSVKIGFSLAFSRCCCCCCCYELVCVEIPSRTKVSVLVRAHKSRCNSFLLTVQFSSPWLLSASAKMGTATAMEMEHFFLYFYMYVFFFLCIINGYKKMSNVYHKMLWLFTYSVVDSNSPWNPSLFCVCRSK